MRKIFILLCLFTPAIIFSQKLSVVADEWPPYQIVEPGGKISGFGTEVISSVLDLMGQEYLIKILPYTRVHHNLRSGLSDAGFLVTRNKERETYLWYPDEPVHTLKHVLFARSDTEIEAVKGSYDFLKGYSVGLTREYIYPDDFLKSLEENNIRHEYVTRDEQNFMKLDTGRIDFVVADISNGLAIIRKNSFKSTVVPVEDYVLAEYSLYMVWSKKLRGKKWADTFSDKLAYFKKTEKYRLLSEKYFAETVP